MRKSTSCSLTTKLLAVGLAIVGWTASSLSASATEFVFDMTNIEGDAVAIQVTVKEIAAGDLQFTVEHTDIATSYADLRGILFHVNETLINVNDLNFTYVSAFTNSGVAFIPPAPGIMPTVGSNDVNFQGLKKYDVLVEFGSAGETPDDIRSIIFNVSSNAGNLDLFSFMPVYMNEFMAIRITSVWTEDDHSREGSGKLTCCGTTVPEPSSSMGLLAFAIGGLLWRRRVMS